MKKAVAVFAILGCMSAPAFGAPKSTPGHTPQGAPGVTTDEAELAALLAVPGEAFPEAGTLPAYMLNRPVPLSGAEKESLSMANEWAARYARPLMLGNGKLVWMYGVSRPTVVGSPMQVCDIELQPGERVNGVMVGDSARWLIELGKVGGGDTTEHVFVKPLDAGLETTAVITTDRRVYHLRLVSHSSRHTPYVGFLYPEDQFSQSASLTMRAVKETNGVAGNSSSGLPTGSSGGSEGDLSRLSFAYAIQGDAKWRPEQVYDDGGKTFLRLPAKTVSMPILLAKDSASRDLLVNYRVQGSTFVVDGVFERLVLLLGAGKNQEKVEIRRKS